MSAVNTGFRCLAIESSTGAGSIAVANGADISVHDFSAAAQQSRQLYAGIRDLLAAAELTLADLDGIAFGCGPGTFTGLRVTAAATQALAYGANLPVMRVSSLAALAAGARQDQAHGLIAASLDARMDEAYLGVYACRAGQDMQVVHADCLVRPAEFRLPIDAPLLAVGPGWSACPQLLDNHAQLIVAQDFARVPSARDVLSLAENMFRAGQTIKAEEALPNYVRNKVTD